MGETKQTNNHAKKNSTGGASSLVNKEDSLKFNLASLKRIDGHVEEVRVNE